jgi:hypothetical protein
MFRSAILCGDEYSHTYSDLWRARYSVLTGDPWQLGSLDKSQERGVGWTRFVVACNQVSPVPFRACSPVDKTTLANPGWVVR